MISTNPNAYLPFIPVMLKTCLDLWRKMFAKKKSTKKGGLLKAAQRAASHPPPRQQLPPAPDLLLNDAAADNLCGGPAVTAPSLIVPPPQRPAVAARSRPQLELEGDNEDEAQDLLSPLPEGRELSPQRSNSGLSGPSPRAVRTVGAALPSTRSAAAVDSVPLADAGAADERDRLGRKRSRLLEEAVAAMSRPPGDPVREEAPRLTFKTRHKNDLNVGLLGHHHHHHSPPAEIPSLSPASISSRCYESCRLLTIGPSMCLSSRQSPTAVLSQRWPSR